MSERKISISVPLESGILKEAAAFLNKVATMGATGGAGDAEIPAYFGAPAPDSPIPTEVADAVTVFNEDTPDAMGARIDDTVATTEATLNPHGVELDAEGLPWDARIHSDSRKKLAKGNTWKLMRGIDKQLVKNVKAELKAAFPPAAAGAPIVPEVPVVPEIPVVPEVPVVPVTPGIQEGAAVPAVPLAPGIQEGAAVPAVPVIPEDTAVPGTPITYQTIIDQVTERAVSGKLQPGEIETILGKYGIADLTVLGSRPDKWAEVHTEILTKWV